MTDASMQCCDIAIIGGGMVGAALACRLAVSGLQIRLVEGQAPAPFEPTQAPDLRVSAISPASVALLEQCGAWEAVQAMRVCPYRRLETWEQGGPATRFGAAELGLPELGFIVENRLIQLALWQRLTAFANVQIACPARLVTLSQQPDGVRLGLDDGRCLQAQLVLGADGAGSRTRELAHIGLSATDYRQHCLLVSTEIEGGQQDITWQEFHPSGPRAFLPLHGEQASLVWYDSPARVRALAALGHEALAREIRRHFPARLPALRVTGCGHFPLTRRHAQRYVQGRVVLLGDAAHSIHPLAGQGVNLGFKDVRALSERLLAACAAGEPWDSPRLLAGYQQARRLDNSLMQTGMDIFYLAFSNDLAPLRLVRNLGLLAAGHAGPLKRAALKYALGL